MTRRFDTPGGLFNMGAFSGRGVPAAGEEWICESGDGCARWVAWCWRRWFFFPLSPRARTSRRCAACKGARADDEEHQPRDAPGQGLYEEGELQARRGGGGGNRAALGGDSLLEPQGQQFGKTRIKDEVWSRFGDYTKIARDSAQIAREVAKAAVAKDKAGVLKAFSALSDSCTQCHKPYRKKKKRSR